MARPKGSPKLGGRKKGTPNKISADIRSLVLETLETIGGKRYLMEQSAKNPNAFMALLAKCMPNVNHTELTGADGQPMQMQMQDMDKAEIESRIGKLMAKAHAAVAAPVADVDSEPEPLSSSEDDS